MDAFYMSTKATLKGLFYIKWIYFDCGALSYDNMLDKLLTIENLGKMELQLIIVDVSYVRVKKEQLVT